MAKKKKKKQAANADSAAARLKDLRRDIDAVDRDLLKLLGRRAALVQKVGRAKQGGALPVHHPGREAQVLGRLLKRHRGAYPPAAILRIWREIIAASVRLQDDFTVAIPASAGWALPLARAHFGEVTPVAASSNPLSAVAAGRASAAVLSWPGGGGASLWWRRFALDRPDGLTVLWALPYVGTAARRAVVVGRAQSAPSGDDATWLALEGAAKANSPRGVRRIAQAGRLRLVERDGYISAADAASLTGDLKAAAVHWLGCFPKPLGALDGDRPE